VARNICTGFGNVGVPLVEHLLGETPKEYDPNSPGGLPWAMAVLLRGYGVGERSILLRLSPEIRKVVDKARAMYKRLNPARSTFADSVRIADEIIAMLKQMAEDAKPPEQPPEQQPGEGEQKPDDEGQTADDTEGEGEDASDADADGTHQPDDADAEGDSGKDDEKADAEGEGEGEAEQNDTDTEGDDEGDGAGDGDGEGDTDEGDEDTEGADTDGEGKADGDKGDTEGDGSDDGDSTDAEGEGEQSDGDAEGDAEGEGENDAEADAQADAGDAEGEADGDTDGESKSDSDDDGPSDGAGGDGAGDVSPLTEYADTDKLAEGDMTQVEPTLESEQAEDDLSPVEIGRSEFEDLLPQSDGSGQSAAEVLRQQRSAGVRSELKRLLVRTDVTAEERGLKRGRIVASQLANVLVGEDRVFSRRWEEDGEDAAVSIMVDVSGSMSQYDARGNRKIEVAMQAALLIAECLSQTPGVKCEAAAFPSDNVPTDGGVAGAVTVNGMREDDINLAMQAREAYLAAGGNGDNAIPGTGIIPLKKYGEHIGLFRRRFFAASNRATGGTPDLAALDGAAKRLLQMNVGKRIIFMLCDGVGNETRQFRAHVDMLHKRYGIIVVGLGIGCDADFLRRFKYATVVADASRLAEDSLRAVVQAILRDRA